MCLSKSDNTNIANYTFEVCYFVYSYHHLELKRDLLTVLCTGLLVVFIVCLCFLSLGGEY